MSEGIQSRRMTESSSHAPETLILCTYAENTFVTRSRLRGDRSPVGR